MRINLADTAFNYWRVHIFRVGVIKDEVDMDKKTNKHQQALEQLNDYEKNEKDEGKPNKLKNLTKAVDWTFRIERAISWIERLFEDEWLPKKCVNSHNLGVQVNS